MAVVSAGLDAFVPFEVQDAAKLSISQTDVGLAALKATELSAMPGAIATG